MENTISLPKPVYKEKMTEFAKDPRVELKKSKNKKYFDKLLDKNFLNKYFSISDKKN